MKKVELKFNYQIWHHFKLDKVTGASLKIMSLHLATPEKTWILLFGSPIQELRPRSRLSILFEARHDVIHIPTEDIKPYYPFTLN